ncbi:hypothetical protein [Stutzerimonas nitrititolerans]|uniref:hypothetical protein n=1 Tax=Stutzerimonas nitrititolerans TaxID=2482751 RepID=UPI0028B03BF0|nr:hypothetical protein [Stutzerimonas nitrititolerans]
MKPSKTLREHFAKLRSADHQAHADYHCNLLYGYALALHESGQIEASAYFRIMNIVTTAWRRKTARLAKQRSAA